MCFCICVEWDLSFKSIKTFIQAVRVSQHRPYFFFGLFTSFTHFFSFSQPIFIPLSFLLPLLIPLLLHPSIHISLNSFKPSSSFTNSPPPPLFCHRLSLSLSLSFPSAIPLHLLSLLFSIFLLLICCFQLCNWCRTSRFEILQFQPNPKSEIQIRNVGHAKLHKHAINTYFNPGMPQLSTLQATFQLCEVLTGRKRAILGVKLV